MTIRRPAISFLATLALLAARASGAQDGTATDTLFTHGTIYRDADTAVSNLVVRDGYVLACNVRPEDYPAAAVVDLGGGVAYPGFNDSHVHIMEIGSLPPIMVDLSPCRSSADIAAAVAAHTRLIPETAPILGSGFSLPTLSNTWTLADLALLDSASGGHEVLLLDNLGHNCIVNSRIISNCHISAMSPVALSGIIDQENGKPTGLLREAAQRLAVPYILDQVPDLDVLASTLTWLTYWASFGYTAINDMMGGAGGRVMRPHLFRDLERQGLLPLRVNYAYTLFGLDDVDAATQYVGQDTDRVRFLGGKIFVDGAFGAGQDWTTWPHLRGDSHGVFSVYTNDLYGTNVNLNRIIERADDVRLNMHYHVQGDAAIDAVLNALDAVVARKGRLSSVHTIIHVAFPRPDQILKMRAFGSNIVATVQPGFWAAEANAVYYYGDQFTNSYPIMDLVNGGVTVGMGTDFYVSPLRLSPPQVFMAIGMSPSHYDPPSRTALTMKALVRGLTEGSAATTAIRDTGTLHPGAKADMVVYNRDLYAVTPAELTNGTVFVQSTWIGGCPAYNARAPKPLCGDLDGDGKADLMSATGPSVWAWLSSRGYASAGPFDLGLSGIPLAGDVDGDGRADLISVSGANWSVCLSRAHYATRSGPYAWGVAGSIPAVGDIDGDRRADLICVAGSSWYVRFSGSRYATLSGPFDMAVSGTPVTGDLDGDGLADLIIVVGADWYVWYSSMRYATLSGPYQLGVVGTTPLTGDLDGDRRADLIFVSGSDVYVRLSSSRYASLFGPYRLSHP
jgi:predicted amidohydrolase YtcJ